MKQPSLYAAPWLIDYAVDSGLIPRDLREQARNRTLLELAEPRTLEPRITVYSVPTGKTATQEHAEALARQQRRPKK